jgi:hypothetical protein
MKAPKQIRVMVEISSTKHKPRKINVDVLKRLAKR